MQCFPSPYEGENRCPHLDRASLQEPMHSSKSQYIYRMWQGSFSGKAERAIQQDRGRKNHLPAPWKEQVLEPSVPGAYFTITSAISRPAGSDWLSHCVACDFLLNPSGAAVRNQIKPQVLIDLILIFILLFFKQKAPPKENLIRFTVYPSWTTSAT